MLPALAAVLLLASCPKQEAQLSPEEYRAQRDARLAQRDSQLERTALSAPPEQEISVNLDFEGAQPDGKLSFLFRAIWGDYGRQSLPFALASSRDSGAAELDLGIGSAKIKPRVTGKSHGAYDVTLLDESGRQIGSFAITDSGAPVKNTGSGDKYTVRMAYYDEERRLSGFRVHPKGSERDMELGLIFVGKGWKTVEEAKGLDLSKGYIFPEMDMVVLPRKWHEYYRMADTCNTLKRGTATGGGRCYS